MVHITKVYSCNQIRVITLHKMVKSLTKLTTNWLSTLSKISSLIEVAEQLFFLLHVSENSTHSRRKCLTVRQHSYAQCMWLSVTLRSPSLRQHWQAVHCSWLSPVKGYECVSVNNTQLNNNKPNFNTLIWCAKNYQALVSWSAACLLKSCSTSIATLYDIIWILLAIYHLNRLILHCSSKNAPLIYMTVVSTNVYQFL